MDYLVKSADMTVVADAIRTKGGTSAPLTFPDGMAQAVEAIQTGGGVPGDTPYVDFLENPPTVFKNSTIKKIRSSLFVQSGPLTTFVAPELVEIVGDVFYKCVNLKNVDAPKCEIIGREAFEYCRTLEKLDFPVLQEINNYAFYSASNLKVLVIRSGTVAKMLATAGDIFYGTPILSGTGYVYVPRSLVNQYKVTTNWVSIADQIRAIEDYPDITGG